MDVIETGEGERNAGSASTLECAFQEKGGGGGGGVGWGVLVGWGGLRIFHKKAEKGGLSNANQKE